MADIDTDTFQRKPQWTKRGRHLETRLRYDRAKRETGKPKPEEEGLTGQIQDKDATEGEERAARGLQEHPLVRGFLFREVPIGAPWSPGSIEIDFYISTFLGDCILQIDAEDWHDEEKDRVNDAVVDSYFSGSNVRPVKRMDYKRFETQEDANEAIEEVLYG